MKRLDFSSWRFYLTIGFLLLLMLVLVGRLFYLSFVDRNFLLKQSDARSLRVIDIPAYRGMIVDRNGVPLAVSTPVYAAWINPQQFYANKTQKQTLANLINSPLESLEQKIRENDKREFVYLKRGLTPRDKAALAQLEIPGLYFDTEYRRYYPQADVFAHVIGFTNIDDQGQEGLELGFNQLLQGVPGKQEVLKDRRGNIVAELSVVKPPEQGHDLAISLDSRIQYVAYQALQQAATKFNAESGSIVVLNAKTGEILAMVNVPSYNPNYRSANLNGSNRNRAVTDLFEPGSTMKAFSVAAALYSGKYTPDTIVDTRPGWMVISGRKITDDHNYGVLNVTGVLQKSSNIGVAKMTLSLPPENLWNVINAMGFGQVTESGFPGEATGSLIKRRILRPIDLATFAYGYGLSITALQLAHAYMIIADQGKKVPITFMKRDNVPEAPQVMSAELANQMLKMLQAVVSGGTGKSASIPGYSIAGKTGTAYIAGGPSGYIKNRYVSSFVGIAPVTNPQLIVAVVLRDVKGDFHYGAQVAAPAFSQVMSAALRYMNIPPDQM